jgi:hypothetical protein
MAPVHLQHHPVRAVVLAVVEDAHLVFWGGYVKIEIAS